MAPPVHPVDVFLILHDGLSVLLALRQNTGYHDGLWNLPSGKLEHGEDAVSGVLREAREEIGVRLPSVRLAATVHHRASPSHTRVGLVFAAAFDPVRTAHRSTPSRTSAAESPGSRRSRCPPTCPVTARIASRPIWTGPRSG
jgi:8-oxo-dGTP pyrophosphatase MutT (NUDIX family)